MKYELLKRVIADVNGSNIIGIDTESQVKLKGGKKNRFQGRVTKRTVNSNVMIFSNKNGSAYGDMVKRRLVSEGKDPDNFKLGERKWGVRIEGTPFISHKDKHYLEVIFLHSGKSTYYVDGVETPKEEIEGLDTTVKVNEESQGGLDDKVIVRTYDVESIKGIRIDGLDVGMK